MSATGINIADAVIAILRAQDAGLRRAGIRRLSLFGSVTRGDSGPDSDVDLAAEIDPAAGMDLVHLVATERRLGEVLGKPVEILVEPIDNPRLRANVDRDRRVAFEA